MLISNPMLRLHIATMQPAEEAVIVVPHHHQGVATTAKPLHQPDRLHNLIAAVHDVANKHQPWLRAGQCWRKIAAKKFGMAKLGDKLSQFIEASMDIADNVGTAKR